jgi:hypothetical protein
MDMHLDFACVSQSACAVYRTALHSDPSASTEDVLTILDSNSASTSVTVFKHINIRFLCSTVGLTVYKNKVCAG